MATMQQVADRAGVSIATVSFVVNGTKHISASTKDRVLRAIDELGFEPSPIARALASRRTQVIAMLIPLAERDFNSFVTGAVTAAAERGYKLILWPIGEDPRREVSTLIASRMADGVLLMEVQLDDERVDRLVELGSEFALIGRTRDPAQHSYVDIDFESATELAVDHLVQLGHSDIALVTQSFDIPSFVNYAPPIRVAETFTAVAESRGVAHGIFAAEGDPGVGRRLASQIFRERPDTTAIVVMNNDVTFGLVSGLGRLGKEVPKDVSILSLATSDRMASLSDPQLTRLVAKGDELGRSAALALIDRLNDPTAAPIHELIACDFREGESTGPPPRRRAI
jgi:DNA-binding LacI/PurR family transcriptional regulator